MTADLPGADPDGWRAFADDPLPGWASRSLTVFDAPGGRLADDAAVDCGVLSVPFDGTASSRVGARLGPRAIREASLVYANQLKSRGPVQLRNMRTGALVDVEIELYSPAYAHRAKLEAAIRDALSQQGAAGVKVSFSSLVVRRSNRPNEGGRLPAVKNIVAVAAGKGGVGKSTVATNLALALKRWGATVGLLDADVYGPSVPTMLGEPETPSEQHTGNKLVPAVHYGIKVMSIGFFVERDGAVVWRGPMVHKLLQQFIEDVDWGDLDYLIVDLPPGTGDAQLSLTQLLPLTGVVIVSTPQEVALIDVEKAVSMFKKLEVPILGVIENMSYYICPTCGHHDDIFARGGGAKLADNLKVPLLAKMGPLARTFDFDGPTLVEAVRATFERRRTPIPEEAPLALTETFTSNKSRTVFSYSTRFNRRSTTRPSARAAACCSCRVATRRPSATRPPRRRWPVRPLWCSRRSWTGAS